MIARLNLSDGGIMYAHRPSIRAHPKGNRIIFCMSDAGPENPQTSWYCRQIGAALHTNARRFLFNFQPEDLKARGARIAAAYFETISEDRLIGARHTHFDEDGVLWFRGAFVKPVARGRGIAPVLAAIGLFDRAALGRAPTNAAAAVLVDNGVPNAKSVRALRKLGFVLGDHDEDVTLSGSYRDAHLLPYALKRNDRPYMTFRRVFLPQENMSRALGFIRYWTG